MLKTGILHPQLVRMLTELRYKDTITIGDARLLTPKGMERVDPSWRPDDPAHLDVPKEAPEYIVVEGAVFADEASTVTPDLHKKALGPLLQGLPVEYIPHTELRERSEDVEAIVLTGELTGYTSVILPAGHAY